jgi:hypothetical protein
MPVSTILWTGLKINMGTCYTEVTKSYVRRSKQKQLHRKYAVHAQMSKIHYIKKCYYLRTFLSAEEAGNSVLDPDGLSTMADGPLEEERSGKTDSDSLSS